MGGKCTGYHFQEAETSEYTHTAAEVGVMNTYTVRSYIGSVKSAYDAKGVGTKG